MATGLQRLIGMRRALPACGFIRVMAIIASLLMLAMALCLLDRDGDQGIDMCVALTVAVLAGTTLAAPASVRWAASGPVHSLYTASIHLPDPPPKFFSSAR
jgi:hypothetical protein